MTHYDTIGSKPGATAQQLRRSYLERARKLHPDQFVDLPQDERRSAERAMQELNAAWTILSDPARRRAYDAELAARGGKSAIVPGTGPLVDGRGEPWRPYEPDNRSKPKRPEQPVVADPREMELSGPARLLRPGALVALFSVMVAVVLIASLVASRGDDEPSVPAPVAQPTGTTPLGCIDLGAVPEEVPCGRHDAVVWSIIDGGEACEDRLEAVYRPGVGGAYCVTRVS